MRPRLRQPRPGRDRRSRASSAICPRRLARYRIPALEPFAEYAGTRPARELEGRRRELPRGLPHPDRPPRPDAPARLQALRASRCTSTGSGSSRRCARGPAATAWRALYARLVEPMPGLSDGGPPRLALRSSSTRTPRSTSIPTRSRPGRSCPDGIARTSGRLRLLPPAAAAARARASCSASTSASTRWCSTRTSTSSTTSSAASRRAATSAARCRAREAAVAWLADRVRADLAR